MPSGGCELPRAHFLGPIAAIRVRLKDGRMSKHFLVFGLLLLAGIIPAHAYGPEGHMIIGGIADRKLAHTPAGARVSELLDGYTLAEASLMADTIKQWDKPGIHDPKVQKYFSSHPKIAAQLQAFWQANPPTYDEKSPVPSHHWFHYTDVPLVGGEQYGNGQKGRSEWDIVHMMRYCIEVLQGAVPENNPRKITKPIAVILLAHLVGDIHQPLHVGAQYFDAKGQPVNPARVNESFPDEGGNALRLKLTRDFVAHNRDPKLHSFWDADAVQANLPIYPNTMPKEERRAKMDLAEQDLADRLSKQEPKNWKLPNDLPLTGYPEAWANEIMPLARQVHERLRYENVHPQLHRENMVADGEAVERPTNDGLSYSKWAARVVLNEMERAGWRLTDLLARALAPVAREPTPAPSKTPRPPPSEISPPASSPPPIPEPAPAS